MCFLRINSAYLNLHYSEDAFNFKITGTCGLDREPVLRVFKLTFELVIIRKGIGMKMQKSGNFLIFFYLRPIHVRWLELKKKDKKKYKFNS